MTRNKLATHKTIAEKERAYRIAILDSKHQAMAYSRDGTIAPLVNFAVSDVEFIGGLWRVQTPFIHKIQDVRDKQFVLGAPLPHREKNHFEFYSAWLVSENCYGKYISGSPKYIVAKYTTDHGTYWSYGDTIEQARAFLGIRLYDEYMDLIHAHACKKQLSRQKK